MFDNIFKATLDSTKIAVRQTTYIFGKILQPYNFTEIVGL